MSALSLIIEHAKQDTVLRKAEFDRFRQLVSHYKGIPLLHDVVRDGIWLATSGAEGPLGSYHGPLHCVDGESWILPMGNPFVLNMDHTALGDFLRTFPFEPEHVLNTLEGHFMLFGYNAREHAVYVAGDAVGALHAYYASEDCRVYVSTSVLAIAQVLRSPLPDTFAMESLLYAGGYFGDQTLIRQVKCFEGGKLYILAKDEIIVRRWHSFIPSRHDEPLKSISQVVERFCELTKPFLQASLGKCAWSWCQLTGGYDTRVLAAALSYAGIPFKPTVYGPDMHEDVKAARQISTMMCWNLEVCWLPQAWGTQQWELIKEALGLCDGLYDLTDFSRHLFWDMKLRQKSSLMYSGMGGEMLRDFYWRHEVFRAGRSKNVNIPLLVDARYIHPGAKPDLANKNSLRDFRKRLIAEIGHVIEPFADLLNTTKLDLIYLWKVKRFGCEYLSSSMPYINIVAPLLFRRVLELCVSLPPQVRRRTRLIRYLAPALNYQLADMPTNYGHPLLPMNVYNAHRFAPLLLDDARRVIRKAYQLAGIRYVDKTHCLYNHEKNIMELMRVPEVNHILKTSTMHTRNFFNLEWLNLFIESASTGHVTDPALFGRVLTLELFYRTLNIGV